MVDRENGSPLDRRTVLKAAAASGLASVSGCLRKGLPGWNGGSADAGSARNDAPCPDPPPLSNCLGRVLPVATDAGDGCTTADGASVPATGRGAANWFGYDDCGSWKEYEVESGRDYRLLVYADDCPTLSAVDFDVKEPDGNGGWQVTRHVPERRPDVPDGPVHRVYLTPESDRIRIERNEDGGGEDFYVTVLPEPRWHGGANQRIGPTEVDGFEITLPAHTRAKEGYTKGEAVWEYSGVASQGVTWNEVREEGDRLVYSLGLTGQIVTRRAEVPGQDGELAVEVEDDLPESHPASEVDPPLELPTHTIKRQGYYVDTPGAARVETFDDAYTEDRSDWRYGIAESTVAPERKKSIVEVVGRAFAPSISPASIAMSKAEDGVVWAIGEVFSKTAKQTAQTVLKRIGLILTFVDLWASLANTCNDWERNEMTGDGLERITSVCKGAGSAANFSQVEVSVPRDESARITVGHEFLAGRPFDMPAPSLEREFVLNPDESGIVHERPASSTTPDPGPTTTEDPVILTEGFEEGFGAFENASQLAVEPAFTRERATEGRRSLDLRSPAGNETRNAVRTTESFEVPVGASVSVDRYESHGPENATRLHLVSTETDREVALLQSDYYGGVLLRVYGADGDRLVEKEVTSTTTDGWHDTKVGVTPTGTVVGSAFDGTASYEPDDDWTTDAFAVELAANGWGHGNYVAAAFDSVRVERLRSRDDCPP